MRGTPGIIKLHESAGKSFGMLVELDTVKLDETVDGSWIQIMPVGSWEHPIHGTLEFTQDKLQRYAENFKAGVRGQDLNVNYEHEDGKAAGWFKDVEVRNDGLWALVEWTPPAKEAIANREFRYFSPEFTDEWKAPQTGQVVRDVLFGGAITNRPFLKGILPINLSEVLDARGGKRMDPKKLRKLLGLAEDADDAAVEEALEALPEGVRDHLKTEASDTSESDDETDEDDDDDDDDDASDEVEDKELVALAESNPAVKKLLESQAQVQKQLSEQRKEMIELQKARRLSETQLAVKKLSEGKNALPPTITKKLSETLADLTPKQEQALLKIFKEIVDGGLVELDENDTAPRTQGGKDSIALFDEACAKKCSESDGNLTYWDAFDLVAEEQPALYEAYRQEQLKGTVS